MSCGGAPSHRHWMMMMMMMMMISRRHYRHQPYGLPGPPHVPFFRLYCIMMTNGIYCNRENVPPDVGWMILRLSLNRQDRSHSELHYSSVHLTHVRRSKVKWVQRDHERDAQ